MSTHAVIEFTEGTDTVARLYQHCDGYPDGEHGVLAKLAEFFTDVTMQCGRDSRFSDPSYLAAKYIVWHARQTLATKTRITGQPHGPLDFDSIGVVGPAEPGAHGEEYLYRVACDHPGRAPLVSTLKV